MKLPSLPTPGRNAPFLLKGVSTSDREEVYRSRIVNNEKKIYKALPLQGQVFVFSTLSNNNGIGPITSALGSVYFQTVATGEGMIYSKKETESFLLKAGFKIVDIINLPLDHTLIIGEK